MSNFVFVVDTHKKPLDPVHPGKARKLLNQGEAAVFRRYPFTIILKYEVPASPPQACQLKLDPGSKTTGFAVVQNHRVIWAAELTHWGNSIKQALLHRREVVRRGRRSRKTRYRCPPKHEWFRKGNKKPVPKHRREDWLPPSLVSRIENILTWVKRIKKFCPITGISQELARFDTQKMQDPNIQGKGYQQGTLHQYEVREYVLEKWGRKCAYCGAKDFPLEVEHIKPRSRGGSNRPSNLTLSCIPCNQAKGNQDVQNFLSERPSLLKHIWQQTKQPLADAAAVNSTRKALLKALQDLALPVTTGTGGQTKFNRTSQGVSKSHWHDAAMVGETPQLQFLTQQPLVITSTGNGKRQMCRTDANGFPIRYVPRHKFVKGFQTGDIVKAVVTKGKKKGTYQGRVAVRSSGSFNVSTPEGLVQGISHKYCSQVHGKDGYQYCF
jgi:5-methylcytosine-specific restriction endonuclease McrA